MSCHGSACGVRRIRVAQGEMAVSKCAGGCSAMFERRKRIHEVNTDFRAGETEDETVVTIETSPPLMPPAWVNFLKQRLHLLHLDCKHVGLGESSSCRRRTPLSRLRGWSYRRCSAPTTTSKPRFGTGERTLRLPNQMGRLTLLRAINP